MIIGKKPSELDSKFLYNLIVGGVSPRPIALVSTISKDGAVNLSPFSFYNAFGMNPPCIVFSPVRRSRDGSFKDTLLNIKETGECVVQAVTYDMVEQVNLSSTEFPKGINEFVKSGLTPIASDLVKPPRVKESPFQLECKLLQIVEVGQSNGSANLIICEILKFHYEEDYVKDNFLQSQKLKLVGRNGGEEYTRAFGEAIFQIPRPAKPNCLGFDGLPKLVRESEILNGNQLARLAMAESLPIQNDVFRFWGINNLVHPQYLDDYSTDIKPEILVDSLRLSLQLGRLPEFHQVESTLGKLITIDLKAAWYVIALYL